MTTKNPMTVKTSTTRDNLIRQHQCVIKALIKIVAQTTFNVWATTDAVNLLIKTADVFYISEQQWDTVIGHICDNINDRDLSDKEKMELVESILAIKIHMNTLKDQET